MAKRVRGYVKLQIPAGKATPAPPIRPARAKCARWIGRAHSTSLRMDCEPAFSLSFPRTDQCPTSPASAIVKNSNPSSASASSSRYVDIISPPLVLVACASSRIAVFFPSKELATAVPRSSVSRACARIRSSVPTSSSLPSSFASFATFWPASWAAIARPTTSPSFDSRFVSSAISLTPFRRGVEPQSFRSGASLKPDGLARESSRARVVFDQHTSAS